MAQDWPSTDELMALTPPWMLPRIGNLAALTNQLILAYVDEDAALVEDLFDQIARYDDEFPSVPPYPGVRFQHVERCALAKASFFADAAARNGISMGGKETAAAVTRLVKALGPASRRDDILADARHMGAGTSPKRRVEKADRHLEVHFLLTCAMAAWMFTEVYPARELGRLFLTQDIRAMQSVALGAPEREHANEVPDQDAIDLLATVLAWGPDMLPPLQAKDRNLLEVDLVAMTQIYLLEHPASSPDELAAFGEKVRAHIAAFELPSQRRRAPEPFVPSPTAYSAPKPGQRPAGAKKKRR